MTEHPRSNWESFISYFDARCSMFDVQCSNTVRWPRRAGSRCNVALACLALLTFTLSGAGQGLPPIPGPGPGPGPVIPPPIPGPGPGGGEPLDFEPLSPEITQGKAPFVLVQESGSLDGARQRTFRSNIDAPLLASTPPIQLEPRVVSVQTPVGAVPILIRPAGPNVASRAAPAPEPPAFRPPSFFSAPLPTGSGARALGFAGTFTAMADDATAASWNPAGLINLERPEVSLVFRYGTTRNRHTSSNPNFRVGNDDYQSEGLNYASAAFPFHVESLRRNFVFSLNYQETYDFAHSFSAQASDRHSDHIQRSDSRVFNETQVDQFVFDSGNVFLEVVSDITTRSSSTLGQRVNQSLVADIQFDQEGIIAAGTPALAVEVLPQLYLGGAVNFYGDNLFSSHRIRSRTHAEYTATSEMTAHIHMHRETTGKYVASGKSKPPGAGIEFAAPFPDQQGDIPSFSDTAAETIRDDVIVRGTYDEENEFDDLDGINGTIGFLWTVSKHLTLGGSVDLPWDADAVQKKQVRTHTETLDGTGTRLLRVDDSLFVEEKDVEFEFPLYWAVGGSFRVPGSWFPRFRMNLDVSQALWSDFAFDVKGAGKINPFDGTPYGLNPVDDTWAVRAGTEYLWVRRKNAIPFRFGLVWEQRPAIGTPDDYYGFSVGSGISFGEDPGRLVLDIAYNYLAADNVQTVAPGEEGLSTDTVQQQVYLSAIWHF